MVKKTESSCSKKSVNKGAWTAEEDRKLAEYVKIHGDKKWRALPANAGLNRCGKSCRLRWLNYLRPGIKRGNISEDEEDLIIRLHNLIGNRWSLIARRLPGRTDNEIKNHWNTHLSKKSLTISELNIKLNHKLETHDVHPSSSSSSLANFNPAFPMSPDVNWAHPMFHSNTRFEGFDDDAQLQSQPQLNRFPDENDFDIDMGRLWDYSWGF